MALLHSERWRELEPEFQAAALLERARTILSEAKVPSHGSSTAAILAKQALDVLHPITRDPEGWAEFEARKAGTFVEQSAARSAPLPQQSAALMQLQAQNAELLKRLEALEGKPKPTEGPQG